MGTVQRILTTTATLLALTSPGPSHANEAHIGEMIESMDSLDLNALMNLEITTASMSSESILDAPASMYVLSRDEIRKRGYMSITDIMKDLPGFDVVHIGGNAELYAYQRGFRSVFMSRTLTLINGRTFNTLWYQDVQLGHYLPVEAIERIEVLYGPAGSIYGPNAFLGVINIITSDTRDMEAGEYRTRVASSMGSNNTKRVDLQTRGKITDLISVILTARMGRSDGEDISDRDNRWMSPDFLNNEAGFGPILDMGHNGYNFGEYANPDDDRMVMANLTLGELEIEGYFYEMSGSNGPQYAGDRAQPANFWPAVGSGIALTHETRSNEDVTLYSEITYRTSGRYGLWLDAFPSWNEGQEEYSYLGAIDFRTDNNAIEFRQHVFWDINENLKISGGYRYLRKRLTKAYDVGTGYYGAYNSNGPEDNAGLYNTYPCVKAYELDAEGNQILDANGEPIPSEYGVTNYETGECVDWDSGGVSNHRMPFENAVLTEDVGGFVESSYRLGDFKLNAGVRYDVNSNNQAAPQDPDDPLSHRGYSALSPRVGLIYRFDSIGLIDAGAVKLLYGKAVQEPAATQLWGGWSGRNAREDLLPEYAQNTELVLMLQTGSFISDFSAYFAQYDQVHVSPPANGGKREVVGFEYKGRLKLPALLPRSEDISAYLNLSYTRSQSDTEYAFDTSEWVKVDDQVDTGDIAPIKAHFGLNIPVMDTFNLNLRGRYIDGRTPFLANALRNSAKKDYFPAYFVGDLALAYQQGIVRFTAQVYNLTNTDYNHPGDGDADAGDGWEENPDGTMNLKVRSSGYRNSLLPQPLRNVMFTLSLDI
ncbi:MAG: TonB-dependent receptor plug domain-containing protein [Myxococcota bacterium]|nr:TonB-dependent receptor plug domain-containing protein [Myxococcota bacterium]